MVIVLMGVSGSGKTTIGKKAAAKLGCPFFDADDFHPAENKERMGRGIALTDGDRLPWLQTLSIEMKKWNQKNPLTLLACSTLKESYREILSRDIPVRWVYLKGDRTLISRRLGNRQGHFFDQNLLDSQFDALEEPSEAIILDISQDSDKMVESLVLQLRESKRGSPLYMEGSTKGFLAILFAILLVVSVAFWPQTKFVMRFIYDLIVMNGLAGLQSLLEYLHQHSPFTHQP